MRIGIITNFAGDCTEEDYILSKSFAEDGHKVDLLDFPLQEGQEKFYDFLILKNAWVEDKDEYKNYFKNEEEFYQRIEKSNIKIVNTLDGKLNFRQLGKRILVNMYKQGYQVIPTIDDIKDIDLLPKVGKYIKKPVISYDGFGMKVITKNKLKSLTLKKEVLQPKMDFISEVEVYFVNDKFEYALEFTPSKYPDYPTPREIKLSKKDIELAKNFIKLNNLTCSFGRVDFLRLKDKSLIMLEMADSNPYMSLPYLKKETLNRFLKNFKKAVYEYVDMAE